MMNYHITSEKKGQEIFSICLILLVWPKLSGVTKDGQG
jgi:hypothetical protein